MRSIAAALLLTLQLRPLFGLALCFGLGTGDVKQMEDGCPMEDHPSGQMEMVGPTQVSGVPVLTSSDTPSASHGCALADACTVVTNAIVPQVSARPAMETSQGNALRPTDPVPDLARFAPPTPPPNA